MSSTTLIRPASQNDLLVMAHNLMTEESYSFIDALYRIIDTLTKQQKEEDGLVLACSKGCSFCCHQPVMATTLEWEEIKRYIREEMDGKARYWTKRRFDDMKSEWLRWINGFGPFNQPQQLEVFEYWKGRRPCPFLNREGACDIYPVRPIDCRTMTNTCKCTDWVNQSGIMRMHYEWEVWANNLILEVQSNSRRMASLTPIIHLLCLMTERDW